MKNAVEKRQPESALDRARTWADMDSGERKRRAALASAGSDLDALSGLLESYLRNQGKKGNRLSDYTLRSYRTGTGRLLEYCGETGKQIHSLSVFDAQDYRAWLQSKYADKTVSLYLTAARRLHLALEWAGVVKAPAFDNVTAAESTDPREKADPYSTEELQRLLNASEPRTRAVVLLAADGGLRLSEAARLTWGAVDLQRRALVITGKGRKLRRPAITARLTEALRALRTSETTGTDPVIISGKTGRGITERGLQHLISVVCTQAGVKARGYHNLRHTCGTRLYEATKDLQAVARHLGHSTTKTSELYAHLADGDYRAAVDSLDGNGVK